ncbi:MAG: UDP-3-O-(3-hydroxymyristoyl)glucosamine N-acyltransferase [Alphaproteobacteria bacterium]|nr:MAG: UDP-3-O-(3-hydroxymyristoyl)glucosamine N-acyltransferase [Alphaproteobacteria bacterium]
MADQRFFKKTGPFTLRELAGIAGASLADGAAAAKLCEDVAPLDQAQEIHVSFLDNKKYLDQFKMTAAGACFVRPELVQYAPEKTVCLVAENPYKAYALAAQKFYPEESSATAEQIAPTAVIDESASLGKACVVGPGAVIGPHVKIGKNTRIQPGVVIEEAVEIGDDCIIGSNAVLSHCLIGSRVHIYPGVCIGQRGFGFAIDPGGFVSVPQLGRVVVEDDVEIGANATIDRGAGPDTVIGSGTRIDNLVQIGHNVKIGSNCVIVSQTGISGSSEIGDFVMLGGQSGIAGHLKIGSGARIAAQSGIMRDIEPGSGDYMGSPAVPMRQFMKQVAVLSKLAGGKKKSKK